MRSIEGHVHWCRFPSRHCLVPTNGWGAPTGALSFYCHCEAAAGGRGNPGRLAGACEIATGRGNLEL